MSFWKKLINGNLPGLPPQPTPAPHPGSMAGTLPQPPPPNGPVVHPDIIQGAPGIKIKIPF